MDLKNLKLEKFWVGTFIALWLLVSTVSTVHSIEFFELSNSTTLAWVLAIAFEIGAMASLGGIILSKGNKFLIWMLFIVLTAFQIHGNMYYAWTHSSDITSWINLFDLIDEESNFQRRLFAFISGGILPIVSLGFIKSLMDYLDPEKSAGVNNTDTTKATPAKDSSKLFGALDNSTNLVDKIGEEKKVN